MAERRERGEQLGSAPPNGSTRQFSEAGYRDAMPTDPTKELAENLRDLTRSVSEIALMVTGLVDVVAKIDADVSALSDRLDLYESRNYEA